MILSYDVHVHAVRRRKETRKEPAAPVLCRPVALESKLSCVYIYIYIMSTTGAQLRPDFNI